MSQKSTEVLAALASGMLFGLGLMLSGMASPANVLSFLNLTAGWNPMLLWVMGGALAVTIPGFWLMRRRGRPFWSRAFAATASPKIDWRLVAGAAMFGMGWGLAGYCPGPALVGLVLGSLAPALFVCAMFLGALMARR